MELLTIKMLCGRLKVSRFTVLRWRKEGLPHIKHRRTILFELEKVVAWLESKGQGNGLD